MSEARVGAVGEQPLPERLVELAIFVPVGIVATVAEELPALAEKGRERLTKQVQVAKMIGRFAVAGAKGRMSTAPKPSARPTDETTPAAPGEPAPPAAPAAATAPAPRVETLPIPGYDTLAASQVVQRLSSLRPDELEAVRRYEIATRGRRTILHRIAQLHPDGHAPA